MAKLLAVPLPTVMSSTVNPETSSEKLKDVLKGVLFVGLVSAEVIVKVGAIESSVIVETAAFVLVFPAMSDAVTVKLLVVFLSRLTEIPKLVSDTPS